jgi:hypothetical protein
VDAVQIALAADMHNIIRAAQVDDLATHLHNIIQEAQMDDLGANLKER